MHDAQSLQAIRQELSLPAIPDELLCQAFCHSSYIREQNLPAHASNQRLEFLGDAVLDLVVAEELFRRHHDIHEGELTRRKALAVRSETLAVVARRLGLGRHLLLGKGEEETGGRDKTSLLGDCMEALIGAIHLAAGIEAARVFIIAHINLDTLDIAEAEYNHKTTLQELVQRRIPMAPQYYTIHMEGPDHDRVFTVEVRLGRQPLGQGSGRTKREAEQNAAHDALSRAEQWLAQVGMVCEDAAGNESNGHTVKE